MSNTPQSRLPLDPTNAESTGGDVSSALMAEPRFITTSSGFAGVSDGWNSLKTEHTLTARYQRADDGNVAQVAELPQSFSRGDEVVLSLGFGETDQQAIGTATAALKKGFARSAHEYAEGWHQYIAGLRRPAHKYQRQFQMAAMVLRAHEDKLHPGAFAASLTVSQGNASDPTADAVGGYHVVWSRDLYHVATAFLAMGDRAAALRGLSYPFNTQQRPDGSFPQNSWLNGKPWWTSLRLDEVSFPIVLAWQLNQTDSATYQHHIRTAANFIVQHGPVTPEERWEEMSGYSPSTIAAEIPGLICAADIARRDGDTASANLWNRTADAWARQVDTWMVTTTGHYGPRYFIRLSPNGVPNSGEKMVLKNDASTWDEREIVDAEFLELVRLGISPPQRCGTRRFRKGGRLGHRSRYSRKARAGTATPTTVMESTQTANPVTAPASVASGPCSRENALRAGERPRRHALPRYDGENGGAGPRALGASVGSCRTTKTLAAIREAHRFSESPRLTCAQFIRLAMAQRDGHLPETPQVVLRHFQQFAVSQTPNY